MKKKVLVVDDDKAILELLKLTLSSAGYEVMLAQDDKQFREKAISFQPNLVILDIMLGDQDGVEIYQELLKKGFSPKIPVVFLSVLAQDIKPAPPQPGRTYSLIAKPFDSDKLVKEIACLLSNS